MWEAEINRTASESETTGIAASVGKHKVVYEPIHVAAVINHLSAVWVVENGGDKLVHGSGGISQPRAE